MLIYSMSEANITLITAHTIRIKILLSFHSYMYVYGFGTMYILYISRLMCSTHLFLNQFLVFMVEKTYGITTPDVCERLFYFYSD